MKLDRKTNFGLMIAGIAIGAATSLKAILEFNLTPGDFLFWAIPFGFLCLLLFFAWRQSKPIAYLRNGRIVLRGEEIDEARLEYWAYRKISTVEHEVVLKYRGFREHHVILPEHEETLEEGRVYSFLKSNLATPERSSDEPAAGDEGSPNRRGAVEPESVERPETAEKAENITTTLFFIGFFPAASLALGWNWIIVGLLSSAAAAYFGRKLLWAVRDSVAAIFLTVGFAVMALVYMNDRLSEGFDPDSFFIFAFFTVVIFFVVIPIFVRKALARRAAARG